MSDNAKVALASENPPDRLDFPGGVLLGAAVEAERALRPILEKAGARRVTVVGEVRRGLEIVPHLELMVTSVDVDALLLAIREADEDLLLARARKSGSDRLELHLQGRGPVILERVPEEGFALSLLRRTGPPEHVAALEGVAPEGLASSSALESEHAIYEALGLAFVPPELRCGSLDDARSEAPLVELSSLGGVFHVHTDWSDGQAPIDAMAAEATKLGFGLLGISDHSKAASYARGLDDARLGAQALAMVGLGAHRTEANEAGLILLHGIEVDVLEDGSLDLEDDVLAALDFVIASVHNHFRLSPERMTARLVRAVSHPLVTILGHPTGRLLLARKGYSFDLGAVSRAAAANDTYLEINANPQRMDLDAPMVRVAAREGARFVINPDAHAAHGLRDVALGVAVARRAGLHPGQVLNAQPAPRIAGVLVARKEAALRRLAARQASTLSGGAP